MGIGSYHNYFRANISAACFRTSFSIRNCWFSLRKFSSSCSASVRLSFSWLDPVVLMRFTHLSKADAVRSYSRMISLRGFPWLNSATNCFFCSSLKVRFARLCVMVFSSSPFPLFYHDLIFSVRFSVANPDISRMSRDILVQYRADPNNPEEATFPIIE